MQLEQVATAIVDSGIEVHRALGPGLMESVYEHCLVQELLSRRIACRRQVVLPIIYGGNTLEAGYRLDLIVENAIVVEIKAVETLTALHEVQVLTYLKLSKYKVGFLMNFNVTLFKQGVKRFIR